jgi:hypothetical protein
MLPTAINNQKYKEHENQSKIYVFTVVTMKIAVFWHMMMQRASCKSCVYEEFNASIFRAKQSGYCWFAARMYLTTNGVEILLQRYLHCHAHPSPWRYS